MTQSTMVPVFYLDSRALSGAKAALKPVTNKSGQIYFCPAGNFGTRRFGFNLPGELVPNGTGSRVEVAIGDGPRVDIPLTVNVKEGRANGRIPVDIAGRKMVAEVAIHPLENGTVQIRTNVVNSAGGTLDESDAFGA